MVKVQHRQSPDTPFAYVGSIAQEHWAHTADVPAVMAQANEQAGFEMYRYEPKES